MHVRTKAANPPPLVHLDVQLLRSEQLADEKSAELERRLWKLDWFVQYRRALSLHHNGLAAKPAYPAEAMRTIEREVDEWWHALKHR